MLNALVGVVARRNGEIHARIVEHPLGIVVLSYGGLDIEQGGIEGDGAVDVFDDNVPVQTLHADFLSAWAGLISSSQPEAVPPSAPAQPFSMRYPTRSVIAA